MLQLYNGDITPNAASAASVAADTTGSGLLGYGIVLPGYLLNS